MSQALGSLRAFVAALELRGDLIRIRKDVDPRFELSAVLKHVQRTRNLPVLFERVRGTSMPVVSNICGNYAIMARMLGVETSGVAARWSTLTAAQTPGPNQVFDQEAPDCEESSLAALPHITYSEKDAGPYVTAGMITVRDSETGVQNVSYHRMQIINGNELRCRLSTSGDLYRIQQGAEKRGRNLEAAVLIGSAPPLMLAGAATIGPDNSELDLAARIAGGRYPLRKCWSMDLDVPASTEIVLEGEILASERRPEGPYGDWMDFYVPVMNNHVFIVRKVVVRKQPLFYGIAAGSTEEMTLSCIPVAGMIYRAIRTYVTSVKDVTCYPYPQFCIVQMRKQFEGQPRKAMLAAFGAELNRLLYCVVVDEDVNIHDIKDVVWAMTTRVRVDRDIFQIPDVPSFARDPHQSHWGRVGIDATVPLQFAADFERKRVPGEDEIQLEDYL